MVGVSFDEETGLMKIAFCTNFGAHCACPEAFVQLLVFLCRIKHLVLVEPWGFSEGDVIDHGDTLFGNVKSWFMYKFADAASSILGVDKAVHLLSSSLGQYEKAAETDPYVSILFCMLAARKHLALKFTKTLTHA